MLVTSVLYVVSVKTWTPRGWRPPLEPDVSGFSPIGFPAVLPNPRKLLHSVDPHPSWSGTETETHFSCTHSWRDHNFHF